MTKFSDCVKITGFLCVSLLFLVNVSYVSLNPTSTIWFTPIISFSFMVMLCPRYSRDPRDYDRPQHEEITRYGTISKNDRPPSYSSIAVEAEVIDKFPHPDERSGEVVSKEEDQDVSQDGLPTFEEAMLKEVV